MKSFFQIVFVQLNNCIVEPKNERRHYGKYANQAEEYTLGNNKSNISTNGKAHQQKHKQTDNSSKRTAGNRTKRIDNGISHCLGLVLLAKKFKFLLITMQKHNGIVDGKHKLEYCRNGESHIGNAFENDVTSHIDENSNTNGNKQKNRLKEGFAHQQQNNDTNRYSHRNEFIQNIQLTARIVAINLVGALVLIMHFLHDGIYLIAIPRIIGVNDIHSKCFGVMLGTLQIIVDTGNPIKLGEFLMHSLFLCGSQALKHNLKTIFEFDCGKLLVHNLKTLIHVRILGKILGLILVDGNLWNQKRTKKSKCNTYQKENQSVLYQYISKLFHFSS